MTPEFLRRYYILRIISNPLAYGIESNGFVLLKDLQNALDDKRSEHIDNNLFEKLSSHSQKTIKRDIELIKSYFGVEILLKRNSGYYIEDFLFSDNLSEIYDKTERYLITNHASNLSIHITTEKTSLSNNVDFVKLVNAIEQKSLIYVKYDGWYEDNNFELIEDYFQPLHIKEVNKSWYLICHNERAGIFVFCLDARIKELVVSSKKVKKPVKFNHDNYFKYSIGILKTDLKPEKIIIKVVNHHFKYILNNPIHHSQIVISLPKVEESQLQDYYNPDIWGKISIFVEPNYEFLMHILKHNMWIQVIGPPQVVEYVKNHLQIISSYY